MTVEPELWEGSRGIPGRVRPPQKERQTLGSMVEGATPLSLAPSTEQVLVQEQDLQPEVCSEGGLGKPGVCGSQAVGEWGGERSLDSPQIRESVSQPERACACQSEVENRRIKEVTDIFTLHQLVDVIVVSRGWRKGEEGCKHF